MSRLNQVGVDQWVPFRDWHIGILDMTTREATDRYGWKWDRFEIDGIGFVRFVGLTWNGRSRYTIEGPDCADEVGLAVAHPEGDDFWVARTDLLSELGLPQQAFKSISEGDVHYSRMDNTDWRAGGFEPHRRWFAL